MMQENQYPTLDIEDIPHNAIDILIVDDEKSIIKMLSQVFDFEGCKVRIAENGENALSEVYQKKPSLIVLDLMMPGISGLDVCKELKTQREFSSIPIIMLTAKKDKDDRVEGFRVGANEYITKPFEIKTLLQAVSEQILNARRLQIEEGIESHAEFEIMSDFTYIKQVNELIMRMFRQTKLSEEEILEFEYCLNEALMNAIEHGSQLDPGKNVIVSYTLKKTALILSIEDEGQGFDTTSVPDPTTPENILNPRGRGIFIMKKYMDKVEYNDVGSRITLTKFLQF